MIASLRPVPIMASARPVPMIASLRPVPMMASVVDFADADGAVAEPSASTAATVKLNCDE
jgi:hypothetical protein